MINLRVLVPEETVNYIQNPAFSKDTSGWTVAGATLTRSLDRARFGIASGKVVTNGSAVNEGIYYRVSSLSGVSEPITVSVYVRGGGKVRARLRDGGGTSWSSDAVAINDAGWIRLTVSGFSTGTNDLRLYIETSDTSPQVETFYVDGGQLERKAYPTTYCDGDQPECFWNFVRGASTSSRLGTTREGGRWVDLAGPCRGDDNIYVTALGGFGMAPITNTTQPWGNAPGGYHQSVKVNSRVLTMTFHTKNATMQREPEPDLTPLHALRQTLIDLFKPDRTGDDEAFLFEYSDTDGDRPLYIRMRYDGGLEGAWDVRNAWINSFPLRMIAVDPAWQEDSQDVKELSWKINYSNYTTGTVWIRDNRDKWSNLKSFISMNVEALTEGPDGKIYYANRSTHQIYSFDGTTATQIGLVNNDIDSMVISPTGILYIGGNFTTLNGGAISQFIAQYNISTGAWSSVGSGFNLRVRSLCIANNGDLYIGGSFTALAGGGSGYNRLARWDGSQYHKIGAVGGVDGTVYTIAKTTGPNTLYFGGGFDTSADAAVTYNHIAAINTTTNLISPLGSGLTDAQIDNVRNIIVRSDGIGYIATTDSVSTDGRIWEYRGGSFFTILTLVDAVATQMAIGEFGEVYIGGNFSQTVEYGPMYKAARYMNGTWSSLETNIFGDGSVSSMLFSPKRRALYIAVILNSAFAPYTPAYNTVTNKGSFGTFPILNLVGHGTLRYIANTATRQAIYLDLEVFSGEEVEIDFARGKITSQSRGDLLWTLQPGSELRAMYLLPGENEFAVLMDDEVSPTCSIRWTPLHWSADAIAEVE